MHGQSQDFRNTEVMSPNFPSATLPSYSKKEHFITLQLLELLNAIFCNLEALMHPLQCQELWWRETINHYYILFYWPRTVKLKYTDSESALKKKSVNFPDTTEDVISVSSVALPCLSGPGCVQIE